MKRDTHEDSVEVAYGQPMRSGDPGNGRRRVFLVVLATMILGGLLVACGMTPEPETSLEEEQALQLARSWGSPTRLAAGGAGAAASPQVALSGNGTAMAVWQQGGSIYAGRLSPPPFSFGSRCCWDAAALLETSGRPAADPQVAMDAGGNALAVWRQHDGTAYSIYASRFTPAGGWGLPVRLEGSSRDAHSPQVAMDAGGNALAVWIQHDGTAYSVYRSRFNPLVGGWSRSPALLEASPFPASAPRVAMSAYGNAVVLWRQGKVHSYTPPSIYASALTPGDGWSSPVMLDVDSWDWWIGGHDVAMDDDGNASAVWHQSTQKRSYLYARRLTPGGGWSAPVMVASATDLDGSRVAVGAGGEAMAVWRTTTNTGVYTSRFTPASGWAATYSPTNLSSLIRNPQVGVDGGGNAVVLWEGYNGTGYDLYTNSYARTYAPGYLYGRWQWGSPRLLESSGDDASQARIAVSSRGDAVAVWAQSGGVHASVYGY